MPTPKRKLSRSRRDKRSSNKFIRPKSFFNCNNCQAPALSHQICESCGFYKGKKVLETKMDRSLKRGQARHKQQEAMKAKQSQEPTSE